MAKRELEGKIYLCKEFLKAGWICVLGSRQEFMKHVHCLPKGVWFIKSASNIDLPYIKIAKNYGHKIVCLDEEGLIVHNLEYFANNRLTADTIKKIDLYFTWGKKQADYCKKKYFIFSNKIYSMGNPRVDLWLTRNNKYLQKDLNEINNTYGKFILFTTSFAPYNHYLGMEERINLLKRIYRLNNNAIKKQIKYSNYIKNQFDIFRKLITKLDKDIPIPIVIKIHPSENQKPWLELANSLQNVLIDNQHSTSSLISGCSLMIQTESTTAIEAYLKGKPVITFSLSDQRNNLQLELPAKVSYDVNNISEFVSIIHSLIKDNLTFTKLLDHAEIKSDLSNWIENLNGIKACENIFSLVDRLNVNGSSMGVITIKRKRDWLADLLTLIRNKPFLWDNLSEDKKLRVERSWIAHHGNIISQLLDYFWFQKNKNSFLWICLPKKIKELTSARYNHLSYGKNKQSSFNYNNIVKQIARFDFNVHWNLKIHQHSTKIFSISNIV